MKVAILCPGPSLPEKWCDEFFDDYDVVIGVNTAAWKFKVHWLVGADRHIFKPIFDGEQQAPLRGVVTNAVFGSMAQDMGLEWRRPPLQQKAIVQEFCKEATKQVSNDVCAYSFPQAVWLAYEFITKPEDLHIYGMDMAEQKLDFAGIKGDHSRNRWRYELIWLRDIWKAGILVHGNASGSVRAYLDRTSNKNPF